MDESNRPMYAVKEELGGDYYYRCGWMLCDKVVKSEWTYCPYCGTRLIFDRDDYSEAYYGQDKERRNGRFKRKRNRMVAQR